MLNKLYPKFTYLLCGLFYLSFSLTGQADFRADYEKENPAPLSTGLPTEERLTIHEEWLKQAEDNEDTLRQILGQLYLFYDYVRLNDLTTSSIHILAAEKLAEASGNLGWRGGVAFRRGHLHTYLREPDKVLVAMHNSLKWCTEAGDSLCVAESLESLSANYGFMDSFALAHEYFDLALPMIRKFGEAKHLKTALSNYGSLLTSEKNAAAAIPYLQEAKIIADTLGDPKGVGMAIHNLANAFRIAGDTDGAIAGFKKALAHNQQHGYYDKMIRNYAGLRQCYQETGDYESAIAYQEKFYHLQDSLIGSETKVRIAELEAQFQESEQALALERALMKSRQRAERQGTILLILLILASIATGLWYWQNKKGQAEIMESRRHLDVVTRILKEKNEALKSLKEGTINQASSGSNQAKPENNDAVTEQEALVNLFDQSILTSTDWTDFKAYFDKSFPGYVQRLRDAYPAITEAEERLFFLIKLNMKTKEISHLLGISVNSVKKTRNRLRKKLPLTTEDVLEDFIHNF